VVRGKQNEALLLVGLKLGLRPGEISGLPWKAVDLDAGTLEVRQSLKRLPDSSLVIGPTKADSNRTIQLPPDVAAALRTHRQDQRRQRLASPVWEEHGLVFPNSIGRPMDSSNLRRIVKEFAEAAGLGRLSPNELRHSATSLLVDAGTPIHDVSDLLGHSSIRMLAQTYRHKIRSVIDVTEGQSRMLLG
jgi:integrase